MRHTALSVHRVSPDFSPDFFMAYIASMRRVAQTVRSKGLSLYIRVQKRALSVSACSVSIGSYERCCSRSSPVSRDGSY